jgi:hypothetical protein
MSFSYKSLIFISLFLLFSCGSSGGKDSNSNPVSTIPPTNTTPISTSPSNPAPAPAPAPPTPTPGPLPAERDQANVVFSGHSLTDAAVPFIRQIASSQNDDLNDVYQTIPGSPIRVRTRGGSPTDINSWDGYSDGVTNGANLITEVRMPSALPQGELYDTLVITERHDLPSTIQWEGTISLLHHFHKLLANTNPQAKTYLYHSWLDINKSDPNPWLSYESQMRVAWECTASKVNLTLESENLPQNVETIAAGWALTEFVRAALNGNIPGLTGSQSEILDQIFSDNVHLTDIGGFFVGAYSYNQIFGKQISSAAIPSGISNDTGSAIIQLAWNVYSTYRSSSNQGEHEMSSCRQHMVDNVCGPFWGDFRNDPGGIPSCTNFFGQNGNGNPFTWPDPNLEIWPDP